MKHLQIVSRDGVRALDLAEDKSYNPSLADGQVLIKMEAAVINGSDLLFVAGHFPIPHTLPSPVGGEGVGRVEKAGKAAAHLIGKRVVIPPTYEQGTWAEYVVANHRSVVEIGDEGDVLQLGMLGINPPTAYLLLKDYAHLTPRDWIGQTAANGACSQYVIQLAKLAGIKTLNIVRTAEAAEQVKHFGGDKVVVQGDNLAQQIEETLAGQQLSLVLDAVGGSAIGELAKFLKFGGSAVAYGLMSGQPQNISPINLIFNGLSLHGFWEINWLRHASQADIQFTFKHLAGLVAEGKLHAAVEATYTLDEFHAAVEHAQKAGRHGKILFRLQ